MLKDVTVSPTDITVMQTDITVMLTDVSVMPTDVHVMPIDVTVTPFCTLEGSFFCSSLYDRGWGGGVRESVEISTFFLNPSLTNFLKYLSALLRYNLELIKPSHRVAYNIFAGIQ